MKKIFSILAAAVIALSFASCENNGGAATGGNKDIKIAVTGISAKSAFVAVTPTDNKVAFWYSYVSTDELKSYSDSMTIEEYAADDMSYFSERYSFEELANYGLLLDTLSLIPETEYYVYAYTFNEKFEITSDIVVVKFTTPAQAIAGKENLAIAGQFSDATASYGYFQAAGYNADTTKYLSLLVFADSLNTSFTVDDLYANYSYLVDITGQGEGDFEMLDITKANLTSAFNEANATLAITGTFVASNDIQYTLNLTATEVATGAPARKVAAKKNIRGTKDLRLRK